MSEPDRPGTPQTIAQALDRARTLGVDRLDAHLLVLHALGRPGSDRAWLIAHDADPLDPEQAQCIDALLQRRAAGEPFAYIVGMREFHGLTLQVGPGALVPRPETEILVDWALELLQAQHAARVVDLGTGSGAIALALKARCPGARVEAVDASAQALAWAGANAGRLGLEVALRQACWLNGAVGTYDLIVSNPPYVASADPHLPALRHEPLSALASGADGLDDLRAIIEQAPSRLAPGGWLLLEHGWDQAEAVAALLRSAGLARVQTRPDLAGIPRCTGGQRLEQG